MLHHINAKAGMVVAPDRVQELSSWQEPATRQCAAHHLPAQFGPCGERRCVHHNHCKEAYVVLSETLRMPFT
jgi:hypothetical protein